MDIAPNFSANDWRRLDLENNEEDWQTAIDVLKRRLYARYIDPVDLLIKAEEGLSPRDKRFGFTTLAIDFLLIETIQAFKEGLVDTKGKSKKTFTNFLEKSPGFLLYFNTSEQREDFYEKFRCGILHQAEVQSSALVRVVGDLYERFDERETVNRLFFHSELKNELEEYLIFLRNPTSLKERANFKKKMDSIASRG